MLRIYKLPGFLLVLLLVVTGCRKSDNAKLPALERVPVPLIIVDQTKDVLIQNPAQFKGSFSVDLYFKDDVKPKKMDIVVARNFNYSDVRVFKADVTTYPQSFEVTGQQLATLFGIPITDIKPGDTFEFGANMTLQNGRTIPMFTPTGIGYGTGITNLKGSSVLATYRAVCPLNINDFVGPATLKDPDFWEADYPVTVTLEGTDVLKINGFVEDPNAFIKVKLVNRTQTAVVDEQVFLKKFFTYNNATVEGDGVVDACSKKITLNLTYWVDEGNFGTYTATLVK